MKILTGTAIREADRFTIEHEPIESLALMERASEAIAQWICNHISQDVPLLFVVGKGNNGGDGLVLARQLHLAGAAQVAVVIVIIIAHYASTFLTLGGRKDASFS